MSHLFDPFTLRGLTLANRILVSPMCQYSSDDGFADEWHLVHLGSRAVGGAALVFTEATAVAADGRISPRDLGIWDDAPRRGARPDRPVRPRAGRRGRHPARARRHQGAARARPGRGPARSPRADGGWQPVGPSAEPFARRATPRRAR